MINVYKYDGDIFNDENKIDIYDNLKNIINKDNKVFLLISKNEKTSSLKIKENILKENINVVIGDFIYDEENIDLSYLKELIDENEVVLLFLEDKICDFVAVMIGDYFKVDKVNVIEEYDREISGNVSYNETLSLIKAGYALLDEKSVKYAKEENVIIEISNLYNDNKITISDVDSGKDILFVKENDDEIKVVFKDMNVFNEIFYNLVKGNIKFDDLFIVKNIIYLRGNNKKIKKVIDKYL